MLQGRWMRKVPTQPQYGTGHQLLWALTGGSHDFCPDHQMKQCEGGDI